MGLTVQLAAFCRAGSTALHLGNRRARLVVVHVRSLLMKASLSQRPLDLIIVVYCVVHVPVTLLIDGQSGALF